MAEILVPTKLIEKPHPENEERVVEQRFCDHHEGRRGDVGEVRDAAGPEGSGDGLAGHE